MIIHQLAQKINNKAIFLNNTILIKVQIILNLIINFLNNILQKLINIKVKYLIINFIIRLLSKYFIKIQIFHRLFFKFLTFLYLIKINLMHICNIIIQLTNLPTNFLKTTRILILFPVLYIQYIIILIDLL